MLRSAMAEGPSVARRAGRARGRFAYDAAVSALTWVLLTVGALALGVTIGMRWGRHRGAEAPRVAEPPPGPTLADLLQRVFRSAGAGLGVVARSGDVVLRNGRAVEIAGVRSGRPDARAWDECQRVLVTG